MIALWFVFGVTVGLLAGSAAGLRAGRSGWMPAARRRAVVEMLDESRVERARRRWRLAVAQRGRTDAGHVHR